MLPEQITGPGEEQVAYRLWLDSFSEYLITEREKLLVKTAFSCGWAGSDINNGATKENLKKFMEQARISLSLAERLQEENVSLIAEVSDLRDKLSRAQNSDDHNFQRWQKAQESLKATQEGLDLAGKALTKYGLHRLSCAYVEDHSGVRFGGSEAKCDCGFSDTLLTIKGAIDGTT